MKKTLIALMALAGIACGATTIDAKWDVAPTTAGDFYAGAWTFTFTLDETYTIANSGAVLGAWWAPGAYGESGVGSNAIFLTEGANGALTLTVGRGALNDVDFDKDTTFSVYNDGGASDYVVRGGEIQKGVTYTLTASLTDVLNPDGNSYSGMLTIADNKGGTWTAETGDTAWYKNNVAGGGANAASKTMSYGLNAGVLVPEPTTATLSLLALAGLAARRRRK